MALVRGASRLSLGTWGRRSSKYQKFINLANAFLTVCSIIIMCIALLLMYYYHVHDLDFWHSYFYVTPTLMLCLGIFTFATCLYGFLISNMENRITLVVMAVLLGSIFLCQVASVYFSMELKFLFTSQSAGGKGLEEVKHYEEEGFEWVKPKWDAIQSQLRCCGASESINFGYHDYQAASAFKQNRGGQPSVPDSCCKERSEGCGVGKYDEGNQPNPTFFTDGCLSILKELLKNEVASILNVYMALGLVLALVELVTVVLSCAYVAQITRRLRAQDQYSRPADANGDEYVPSLKTRESTF